MFCMVQPDAAESPAIQPRYWSIAIAATICSIVYWFFIAAEMN